MDLEKMAENTFYSGGPITVLLALAFAAGSFVHQDERGILFLDDGSTNATPEVFAIAQDGTSTLVYANAGYSAPLRDNSRTARTSPQERTPSSRFLGPGPSLPGGGNNAPQGGGGIGAPAQPNSNGLVPAPNFPNAGANQFANAPGAGGSGGGLQPIAPINSGGGPFGGLTPVSQDPETPGPNDPNAPLTPVNPDAGPVPAVPEPASWLLMILGVAALGGALRYQNKRKPIHPALSA